jgi:hypothetical protein
LVIKTLDPDPDSIKMLDPDPDSMSPDPQHCQHLRSKNLLFDYIPCYYISLPLSHAVNLQHHQLQELLELLGDGADPGAPGGRPDERILAPLDIEDSGSFQLRAAVHVRQRQQLHTVPVLNS